MSNIRDQMFTPYNPESPSLQTGDEGNLKSNDEEKSRPLGPEYTGFTIVSCSWMGKMLL